MYGALLSAAEGAIDLSGASQAVSGALNSIGGSMNGIITTVLPISLTVIGTVMVVTFGVRVFKRLTGRV